MQSQPGEPGGVRSRLLRGLGATALGPVVTAAIQLGPVPLLLHAWGAAKYGDWLLLSAIPSYLTLSDLGFGDASGSDMTVRVAGGDREGALRTFQSSWVLLTAVSTVVFLLAAVSVWWIPWQHLLNLSHLSSRQAAAIMMVLGVYVLIGQQNGILESGYRCDGNYAAGAFWSTILRLTEAVVSTAVGIVTGSLFLVALTYLGVRLIGTLGYGFLLRRKSPWIRIGIRYARLQTMKQLAAPAFGFMAMPAGHALSLQGFTVVIGALLGPLAVTAFSTLRTLTRVNFQVLGAIAHTIWPELSSAFGSGNVPLARRLHRYAYRAALLSALLSTVVLWAVGPYVYQIWMRHAVSFDAQCFHVLLLVTVANSFWYTSSVVPMSTNAHQGIALSYLGVTAASLGLAWLLIPRFGITGAALSLLLIDACMSWIVVRSALRQIEDPFRQFVAGVFTLPRSAQVQTFIRKCVSFGL